MMTPELKIALRLLFVMLSAMVLLYLLRPAESEGAYLLQAVPPSAQQSKEFYRKHPECLHRPKTEAECMKRCPGNPVGDCLRRVRAEKKTAAKGKAK